MYQFLMQHNFILQTVMHYFAEVEKLSEHLGKQLWLILQRTLSTVRREPTVSVTALRITEREEKYSFSFDYRQDLLV